MSLRLKLIGCAAVLGTGWTLVVVPTAAQAYVPAPPCSGRTCVNQGPYIHNRQGTSCASDKVSVSGSETSSYQDGYFVVLRWSAYCQANWAQLTSDGAGGVGNSRYWVQTWDGHRQYGSGGDYSYMVDGTQLAMVCVMADKVSGDDRVRCSGWF
jgi:hypothetical protein